MATNTKVPTNSPPDLNTLPPSLRWYRDYETSYKAGLTAAFIFTGDCRGLTTQGISHRSFLISALSRKYKIIILYNRTDGFSFPIALKDSEKSARALAAELVTPSSQTQPTKTSSLRAQVRETMGTQSKESDPFSAVSSPMEALRLLEKLLLSEKARGQIALIVDHAEHLAPDQNKSMMVDETRDILITLLRWGQDPAFANSNNPIFLISTKLTELHPDLRASGSGYRMLEVPLPTREERLAYLTRRLAKRQEQGKPILLCDGLTIEELANTSAGLNLQRLEDVLLLGYDIYQRDLASGTLNENSGVNRALVKERKDLIIRTEYSEEAEMIDPLPGGFESLGGAENLIEWARRDVIRALAKGKRRVPKNVLFVGPPGSGKTFFVRALAAEVGFNAVALKSENILGGIVGESEGKLKRFFELVRALSPAIVFVDEIDQTDMSRRGQGSNPVASNLFNMLLQFMSDETLRGKVMMFFATNRPDLLDDALKRLGRMDAIIPVTLPNEDARRGIVFAQAKAQGCLVSIEQADLIAQQTHDYSAADIAAIVAKAADLAERNDHSNITDEDVTLALRFIRPNTPQVARYYTLLAVEACNDTEFLPEEYANLLDDRRELQAEIIASKAAFSEEREGRE